MAIETLVGLYVTDDDLYQKYREGMLPILQTYGGGFGYDFKVSEVLKSEVEEPINRVFTIFFENEDAMNTFCWITLSNTVGIPNKRTPPGLEISCLRTGMGV
jgi:uncharacterized protein (DUF1330 family)